jgi:hypothetical protein
MTSPLWRPHLGVNEANSSDEQITSCGAAVYSHLLGRYCSPTSDPSMENRGNAKTEPCGFLYKTDYTEAVCRTTATVLYRAEPWRLNYKATKRPIITATLYASAGAGRWPDDAACYCLDISGCRSSHTAPVNRFTLKAPSQQPVQLLLSAHRDFFDNLGFTEDGRSRGRQMPIW